MYYTILYYATLHIGISVYQHISTDSLWYTQHISVNSLCCTQHISVGSHILDVAFAVVSGGITLQLPDKNSVRRVTAVCATAVCVP